MSQVLESQGITAGDIILSFPPSTTHADPINEDDRNRYANLGKKQESSSADGHNDPDADGDEEFPECPICYSFFADPVALEACGHSFCRLCIARSVCLAPNGSKCPLCRARVTDTDTDLFISHGDDNDDDEAEAEDHTDKKGGEGRHDAGKKKTKKSGLAAIIATTKNRVGSEAYIQRCARDAEQLADLAYAHFRPLNLRSVPSQLQGRNQGLRGGSGNVGLPVFAMAPGTRVGQEVQLHFFEARYRLLMRRAWDGNRLFVFAPTSAPVPGSRATIVQVVSAVFGPGGAWVDMAGRAVAEVVLEDIWVEPGTGGLACARLAPAPHPLAGGGGGGGGNAAAPVAAEATADEAAQPRPAPPSDPRAAAFLPAPLPPAAEAASRATSSGLNGSGRRRHRAHTDGSIDPALASALAEFVGASLPQPPPFSPRGHRGTGVGGGAGRIAAEHYQQLARGATVWAGGMAGSLPGGLGGGGQPGPAADARFRRGPQSPRGRSPRGQSQASTQCTCTVM